MRPPISNLFIQRLPPWWGPPPDDGRCMADGLLPNNIKNGNCNVSRVSFQQLIMMMNAVS